MTSTVLALAVVTAGTGAGVDERPAQWTVMAYLNGDSLLEEEAVRYVSRLRSVAPSDVVDIVLQVDRATGGYAGWGDFTEARRYTLRSGQGTEHRTLSAPLWAEEANMGDASVLRDFILWGIDEAPAERYALIVMGPGRYEANGTEPGGGFTVGYDASGGGDSLTVREFGAACREVGALSGRKIDVVAVDACFSASAELVVELAPSVGHVVGSPGLLWSGVPWGDIWSEVSGNEGISGAVLADAIGVAYEERRPVGELVVVSADRVPGLVDALSGFCEEATRSMPQIWDVVAVARAAGDRPSEDGAGDFIRLRAFLAAIAEGADGSGAPMVAQSALGAVDALDKALGGGRDGDLVAYFPANVAPMTGAYAESGAFAGEVGWASLVGAYLEEAERRLVR